MTQFYKSLSDLVGKDLTGLDYNNFTDRLVMSQAVADGADPRQKRGSDQANINVGTTVFISN